MPPARPKVVVVGSLNIDLIASVQRLPGPGETVGAKGLIQRFGGKGANQAVAAVRQGAAVSMIGCVGADDSGRAYRKRLAAEGIDVRGIARTHRALTGTALIAVDRDAENMIIVAPGANGELKPAMVRKAKRLFESASAVLLQFEVPMPVVIQVVQAANRAGVPVVLNPSPFREGFAWGKCMLDTLITNELEAKAIFGLRLGSLEAELGAWRRALGRKAIQRLVITRGAKPSICIERERWLEVSGLQVKPVDTVGAGDAFAGTYVVRRAEGMDTRRAIAYANCAGALATLKSGAQESIPNRAETERAWRKLRGG